MPIKCAVVGCTNSRAVEGFRLHKFPASEVDFLLWCDAVRRPEWKSNERPKHPAVCNAHFTADDYDGNVELLEVAGWHAGHVLLKHGVIPSRNLPTGTAVKRREGKKKPASTGSKHLRDEEDRASDDSGMHPLGNDSHPETGRCRANVRRLHSTRRHVGSAVSRAVQTMPGHRTGRTVKSVGTQVNTTIKEKVSHATQTKLASPDGVLDASCRPPPRPPRALRRKVVRRPLAQSSRVVYCGNGTPGVSRWLHGSYDSTAMSIPCARYETDHTSHPSSAHAGDYTALFYRGIVR